MKSKSRVALFILMWLLIPVAVCAGSDDLLSLYTSAKEHDPGIGKAQSRLEASKADSRIALAQLLPRVDANAGISWLSNTSLNYGPREITGSYTGDTYGFSAHVPMFQIPALYNISAARASFRSAEAGLSASRQDLIVMLLEAYCGVLKAQSDEVLYQEEVTRLDQLYEQAVEFKAHGSGSITALLEAKAKRDAAAADSIKATIGRKIAVQQLEYIAGRGVTEVRDFRTISPRTPEPADLAWWLATMENKRPALVQTRELVAQSELQRKSVAAGHLPTITASGGYSVSKGSTFLPEVETRQWSVGLNVSLPIYSGGETNARVERAVAVQSEQRHVLREVHDQGVQKLKQAYLNLEFSAVIIPSLQQKMESALLQLDAVKEGRSVGTRTGVDLLNAGQAVAIARRDLHAALYDNVLRQFQLKATAGILSESDLEGLSMQVVESAAGTQPVLQSQVMR